MRDVATHPGKHLARPSTPRWHVLQISGPLDREFAMALAELVPVTAWEPRRTLVPWFAGTNAPEVHTGATENFDTRSFPLLRGYAKPVLSAVACTGSTVTRVIGAHSNGPEDVLVCTVPYFAPIAERWPGPVVYWLTDLITHYPSSKGIDVVALDKRMCRAATLLCPNSRRLRDYLVHQAGADPEKILIVPNATRSQNIFAEAPLAPAPLPAQAATLQRPIAGVIGNLAGNMDWALLDEATRETPGTQWLFVGPTGMPIADEVHRNARQRVMQRRNTLFVGRQSYGDLAAYARSFDVAVLPYLRCEPTYSGSSTRFYEHLAACRPMFATRGFEELLHKEPCLKLVDTADELIRGINALAKRRFDDGFVSMRWQTSLTETWQARAATVLARLQEELHKQSPENFAPMAERPTAGVALNAMPAVH